MRRNLTRILTTAVVLTATEAFAGSDGEGDGADRPATTTSGAAPSEKSDTTRDPIDWSNDDRAADPSRDMRQRPVPNQGPGKTGSSNAATSPSTDTTVTR